LRNSQGRHPEETNGYRQNSDPTVSAPTTSPSTLDTHRVGDRRFHVWMKSGAPGIGFQKSGAKSSAKRAHREVLALESAPPAPKAIARPRVGRVSRSDRYRRRWSRNCGSCTGWTIRDALAAAEKGLPTTAICTEVFEELGHNLAASGGRSGLRIHISPYPLNEN
jgi:hypothetical protein